MQNTQFTVGDWHVHAGTNTIERLGRSIHLPPRIVDLLCFLAENAGEVVSRDRLVAAVWESENISDQAITQCVSELRKFLRDDRSETDTPNYIQTVPKRGYRLVCPVSAEAAPTPIKRLSVSSAATVVTPTACPQQLPETASNCETHSSCDAAGSNSPGNIGHETAAAAPRKSKKVRPLFGWARCLWLNKAELGFRQCY